MTTSDALGWIAVIDGIRAQLSTAFEARARVQAVVARCRSRVDTTVGPSNPALTARTRLNCPQCGLGIELRASWSAIAHCPGCIAWRRRIVALRADIQEEPAATALGGDVSAPEIARART